MTNYNQVTNSGDGTRPVTDGGVNNIGAGEKLTTKRTDAGGEVSSPAPKERMSDNRHNVEGTEHDDSAAFELHEDLSTDTNKEPSKGEKNEPLDQHRR
jgi:hypothetical protein